MRASESTPPPIAVPRVATKELALHIQDETTGLWHRLHASTVKAACGLPVNYHRSNPKVRRVIEHPLAPCQCWTDDERAEADAEHLTKFGEPYRG